MNFTIFGFDEFKVIVKHWVTMTFFSFHFLFTRFVNLRMQQWLYCVIKIVGIENVSFDSRTMPFGSAFPGWFYPFIFPMNSKTIVCIHELTRDHAKNSILNWNSNWTNWQKTTWQMCYLVHEIRQCVRSITSIRNAYNLGCNVCSQVWNVNERKIDGKKFKKKSLKKVSINGQRHKTKQKTVLLITMKHFTLFSASDTVHSVSACAICVIAHNDFLAKDID